MEGSSAPGWTEEKRRNMNSSHDRYRVIFAKDAQDLEGKLNDPAFAPAGYAVTHLTFNSARAEYLVILENQNS